MTGVGKAALLQEIQRVQDQRLRAAKKKQTRRNLTPVAQIQPKARQLRYENPRSARAEEGILRLLMLDGSLVKQTQGLEPGQFSAPVLGKIYQVLLEHLKQGRPLQLGTLEGELEGEEIALLADILGQPTALENGAKAMADYRAVLETERMKQQTTTDEAVLLAARETYRKKKSI
ncbi:MAG: DnaB-like helicase N-terminal domain-containing protein [Evtepia gabavorous]